MMTKKPNPPAPPAVAERPAPKVHFDWQDWLPYVAHADSSEAEKRELIETLWTIVISFVDLGWEVSEDSAIGGDKESCGQNIDLTAALRAAVLNSQISSSQDSTRRQIPRDDETEDAA